MSDNTGSGAGAAAQPTLADLMEVITGLKQQVAELKSQASPDETLKKIAAHLAVSKPLQEAHNDFPWPKQNGTIGPLEEQHAALTDMAIKADGLRAKLKDSDPGYHDAGALCDALASRLYILRCAAHPGSDFKIAKAFVEGEPSLNMSAQTYAKFQAHLNTYGKRKKQDNGGSSPEKKSRKDGKGRYRGGFDPCDPFRPLWLEKDSDDVPMGPSSSFDAWDTPSTSHDDLSTPLEVPSTLPEHELAEGEIRIHGPAVATTRLKGRLRRHYKRWQAIGASPIVLNWIKHCYSIPFEGELPQAWHCPGNHTGADTHRDWLRSALTELVSLGCVDRWLGKVPPKMVSPLNVVPKATPGKYRLILDLQYVNRFLKKFKFRMDSLGKLRNLFRKGDWMVSVDLQAGYHHLSIKEDHHTYMGFQFEGQYYVFTCLPFGLTSAPYAFTLLTRQLVRKWRGAGIRMIHYLDDFLWLAPSRAAAAMLSRMVLRDLADLGWLVNFSKSHTTPTQHIKHLGFIIDTIRMVFDVPSDRRDRLIAVATSLLEEASKNAGRVSARLMSRVAGHTLSLFLALGRVVRLRTRYLYRDIRPASLGHCSWDARLNISEESLKDVRFWLDTIAHLPPSPIHLPFPQPQHILYTDAGEEAWGGVLFPNSGHFSVHERHLQSDPLPCTETLDAPTASQSSTFRELFGIRGAITAFQPLIANAELLIRTDSQSAVRIWGRGGSQKLDEAGDLHIHQLVLDIDSLFKTSGINPWLQWIPRDFNEEADFWTHLHDVGDWSLSSAWFHRLNLVWGPFTVDRMASPHNFKVTPYYSRFYSSSAAGLDCFSVADWSGHNNFVHPDFNLIGRVISHMSACRAYGALVVPEWQSAIWWPLLFPADPSCEPSPVREVVVLPPGSLVPEHPKTIIRDGFPPFRILALRVDFSAFQQL